MNEAELALAMREMNRRIRTVESSQAVQPRRQAAIPAASVQSLAKVYQAAKAGWLTGNTWEPFEFQTPPSIAAGGKVAGSSLGIMARSECRVLVLASCFVTSTSSGSDALFGLLVDGAPTGEVTKVECSSLLFGATGTWHGSASLSTILNLQPGEVVCSALNVQNDAGLTAPEGAGFLAALVL